MELCNGVSLEEYYRAVDFNVLEFCRIMIEIIQGVKYLHQNDVAHCGIRPENVTYLNNDKNYVAFDDNFTCVEGVNKLI